MGMVWKASDDVNQIVQEVASKHHFPRLEMASIAVAFEDSKPFVKNRFNWGKISTFSKFSKIWQHQKFDFCMVLCSDAWANILDSTQKNALIDLHLTRCEVEYVAETTIEGKKKKIVKDDWGRVKYTDEIKTDDDGNPKWYVAPLDVYSFAQNVGRYGLWCNEFCEIQSLFPSEEQT